MNSYYPVSDKHEKIIHHFLIENNIEKSLYGDIAQNCLIFHEFSENSGYTFFQLIFFQFIFKKNKNRDIFSKAAFKKFSL